jgi:hypothetical protein
VQERDRFFMAMLKPLGIEKGKPFKPDERQKKLLTEGASSAKRWRRPTTSKSTFPAAHYVDGRRWEFALALDPSQRAENYDELDERAAWFYEATTTSAGMVTTTPGVGRSISAPTRTRRATGSMAARRTGCGSRRTRRWRISGR